MAADDSSLYYSVALGVLLTAAYALSNIHFQTACARIGSAFGRSQKAELEDLVTSPEAGSTGTAIAAPKVSPNWWTNEEIFQLERRAIFSKVGKCTLG